MTILEAVEKLTEFGFVVWPILNDTAIYGGTGQANVDGIIQVYNTFGISSKETYWTVTWPSLPKTIDVLTLADAVEAVVNGAIEQGLR